MKRDKEKKLLEKKYKDYIGKWFEKDQGPIYKILGIVYVKDTYYRNLDGFQFLVYMPNHMDGQTVYLDQAKKELELTEEEVIQELIKKE